MKGGEALVINEDGYIAPNKSQGNHGPLSLTGRHIAFQEQAGRLSGLESFGTASSWWNAAWREGNLITGAINWGLDKFILAGIEDSPMDETTGVTRFETEFNKDPESFLGMYADYTDEFPGLRHAKSLGELNYIKFQVSRDAKERAALGQGGFSESLLPYLMIGSLSPENWIPIASAARLGFLGKGAVSGGLFTKVMKKVSPRFARRAASQIDEIMDPAFVEAVKRLDPSLTMEQIQELAVKRLIAGSPLSHKVGATAIEGMLTAALAEPLYHMDQPLRTKMESVAIIVGSGVMGGGFGAVFGGIGSAYGKVLGDKLGIESMVDFRFSVEEQVGREWGEIDEALVAEGLPTMMDTLSEELGADQRTVDEALVSETEVLEQVSLDALDNPLEVEAAQKRVEIINRVIQERDTDSPIGKLVGLGNDNSWFGKLLARTVMWSPNLRSAWTLTVTEDLLYQRLGANAMTRTRGAADALGDLTAPSMDTAETLASMEGLRRVIALGDVYRNSQAEMGNLTESEFRSLVAKAARRDIFDPEEASALDASLMPKEASTNRVYDYLEGKTPEQVRAIQDAVGKAVNDHYTPYIDEVTKIFKAVGMIPDSFDQTASRRHAARYVTRQYDRGLITSNRTRFMGAVKAGLKATREREMPRLERSLADLDSYLAELKGLLAEPDMTEEELIDTRALIQTWDRMRSETQEDMNALNVVENNADLEALLDQVVRNLTGNGVMPGSRGGSALESSLMARVLDLEDKFVEPYLINDIGLNMTNSVKRYFPKVVAFRYLASADQVRSLRMVNEKLAEYDRWFESNGEKMANDTLSDAEREVYLELADEIVMELNFLNMHNGLTTVGPTRNSVGGLDSGAIDLVNGAGDLDLEGASNRIRALLEQERAQDNELHALSAEMDSIRRQLSGEPQPAPMGSPRRRASRPRVDREANSLMHPLLVEDIATRVLIDHADEVSRRIADDPSYQASSTRVGLLAHELEATFDRTLFTEEDLGEIDARIVGDAPVKVRRSLDDSYNTKKELHRSRENEDGSDVGRTVQNMTKGQYLSYVVDKVLHTRVKFDRVAGGYLFPAELTDIATPGLLNAILDNSDGGYIYNANQASLPRGQHLFDPVSMKSVIQGFNRADATTALHEQMHGIRKTIFTKRYLDGGYGDIKQQDLDTAANWSAAQAGESAKRGEDGDWVWSTAMEEAFADGFEKYIQEGVAPTTALKRTFEILASILKTIYETSQRLGHIDLSPEMRGVYDKVVQRGEFLENNNHPAPKLSGRQEQDVVRAFNLTGRDEIGAIHTILNAMGLQQDMVTYESPTIAEFTADLRERRRQHQVLADQAAQRRNDDIVENAERQHEARTELRTDPEDEDGVARWQEDIEWDGDIGVLRQPDDLSVGNSMEEYFALQEREDARFRDAETIGEHYERIDDVRLMEEAEANVAAETLSRQQESAEAVAAIRVDTIFGQSGSREKVETEIGLVSADRVVKLEELMPPDESTPARPTNVSRPSELPVNKSSSGVDSRGRKFRKYSKNELLEARRVQEDTARGFAGSPSTWVSDVLRKFGKHVEDLGDVEITDLNKVLMISDLVFDKDFATGLRKWAATRTNPEDIVTSPLLNDLVTVARGGVGEREANLRLWSPVDDDSFKEITDGESMSGIRNHILPVLDTGREGYVPSSGREGASATYFMRDKEGKLHLVGVSNYNAHYSQRNAFVSVTDFNGRYSHPTDSVRGAYTGFEIPVVEAMTTHGTAPLAHKIATGEYAEIPGLGAIEPWGVFQIRDPQQLKAHMEGVMNTNELGSSDPTFVADQLEATKWMADMDSYFDGGTQTPGSRAIIVPIVTVKADVGFQDIARGSTGFRSMLGTGMASNDNNFAWQVQFAPNTYYKPESNIFLAMLGVHLADGTRPGHDLEYSSLFDGGVGVAGTAVGDEGYLDIPVVVSRFARTPEAVLAVTDMLGGSGNTKEVHGTPNRYKNSTSPSETIVLRPELHDGVKTELVKQGIKKVQWSSEFESGSKLEFGIESSQELRDLGLGENVGVVDLNNVGDDELQKSLTIALQRMRPYNPMEIAIKLDHEGNTAHRALKDQLGAVELGPGTDSGYIVIRAEDLLPGMTKEKPPLPDFLRYTGVGVTLPLANPRLRDSLAATLPAKSDDLYESSSMLYRRNASATSAFDSSKRAGSMIPEMEGMMGGNRRDLTNARFVNQGNYLEPISPYHQSKSAIHGIYVENPDGGYVRTGNPVGFMDRSAATFLDTTGEKPVLRKLDDLRATGRDSWLPRIMAAMSSERAHPESLYPDQLRFQYPHLGELVDNLRLTEEQFLKDFEKAESLLKERKGMAIHNIATDSMGPLRTGPNAEDRGKPYTIRDAVRSIALGNPAGSIGIYLEMAFELTTSVGLDRHTEPLRLAIDALQSEHKRLSQTNPEWMHVRDKAQAVAGGMEHSLSTGGLFGGGNPKFELSDAPILMETTPRPGFDEADPVSMLSAVADSLSDHRPPDTDTALPALERLDPSGFDQLSAGIREHLAEFNNDEHSIYALSDGSGAMAINHDGVVVKLTEEMVLDLGGESSTAEPSMDRVGTQKLLLNMAILNGAKGIVLPGVHPDNFGSSSEVILAAADLGFIPIAVTGKGGEEGAVPHAVMALHLFGGADNYLDSTGKFKNSRQDAAGLLNAPSTPRLQFEKMVEQGGFAASEADRLTTLGDQSPYRVAAEFARNPDGSELDLKGMGDIHTDTRFMHRINNKVGSDSSIDPNTLRHAVPRLGHIFTLASIKTRRMLRRELLTEAFRPSPYSGLLEIKPEAATGMIVDFSAKNNIGKILKDTGKKVDIKERLGRTEEGGLDPAYGLDQKPDNRGLQPFIALAQDDIPNMDYNAKARRKVEADPDLRQMLTESPSDKLADLGAEQRRRRLIGRGIEASVPVRTPGEVVAEWGEVSAMAGRPAVLPNAMHTSRRLRKHVDTGGVEELLQQAAEEEPEVDIETRGRMDRLEELETQLATLHRQRAASRKLLGEVAKDLGTRHTEHSGARSGQAAYTPLPKFRHKQRIGSNMATVRATDSVLRMHLKRIKGETFKDGISLESQFAQIEREYAPLIREAEENGKTSAGHTVNQLLKRKRVTKEDTQGMLERVLGTHGMNTDASEFAMRLSSTARDFNYLRMMGGVTLSSMPDMAMAISTAGLRNYMGAWGEFLKGNLTSEGMNKDGMSYLMFAAETVLGEHRAQKTNMLDEDIDQSFSWGEKAIHNAAAKFGKISGIQHWNGTMKAIAASAIQSRMMEIGYKIESGKASDLEKEMLRQFGVSPNAAARAAYIHKRVGETGRTMTGKDFHLTRIDRWDGAVGDLSADEVARSRNLWRMSVVQAVNRTIVTPGVGDLPLMVTATPWGKMLFQFKGFTMAATQQVLISGAQRGVHYGDMSQLVLLLSLTSVGSMVYALKELMAGRDPFDREDWLMKLAVEGVDRGGALGALSEVNAIAEKVAGYGLSSLTETGPLTRYMKRNKLDAVLGPSYGLFGDLLEAGGVAPQWLTGQGEISKGQATAIRRLLPWQNLLQTRFLLDVAPNAAGKGGYFDGFKNIQERIRTGDFY